jgi:hypothetical protein
LAGVKSGSFTELTPRRPTPYARHVGHADLFVKLARSLTARVADIAASLRLGLSNARVESISTKLRLLTRIAFGFRSSDALVALALLSLKSDRHLSRGS